MKHLESLQEQALATSGLEGPALMTTGSLALFVEKETTLNISRPCPDSEDLLGCPRDQHEVFIAQDPSNPSRLFAVSKSEPFDGLFTAPSIDGGESQVPGGGALLTGAAVVVGLARQRAPIGRAG